MKDSKFRFGWRILIGLIIGIALGLLANFLIKYLLTPIKC